MVCHVKCQMIPSIVGQLVHFFIGNDRNIRNVVHWHLPTESTELIAISVKIWDIFAKMKCLEVPKMHCFEFQNRSLKPWALTCSAAQQISASLCHTLSISGPKIHGFQTWVLLVSCSGWWHSHGVGRDGFGCGEAPWQTSFSSNSGIWQMQSRVQLQTSWSMGTKTTNTGEEDMFYFSK